MERCDLLVVGAGMAGLAAAVTAIELGAKVTVVEKAHSVGGSAAMAAGILWGPPDYETLRDVAPNCNPELGRALVDGFQDAVHLVRDAGVEASDEWYGQMGYGIARHIDITTLLRRWRQTVESRGELLLASPAKALTFDDSRRVEGVRVARDCKTVEITANATLIATGGFQGNRQMLRDFIASNADRLVFRSNPGSTGDGFRLGRSAGAAASSGLGGFYGHLLPSPLTGLEPADYLPLTLYYSKNCLLVNRNGERFADEPLGDEISNQALLHQPEARGLLLFDEKIRTTDAVSAPYPHGQQIDRVALARKAGARVASAATVDELLNTAALWKVSEQRLRRTVDEYGTLVTPPFYAMEVQPSITFTFGGLTVDVDGRVLDNDCKPIPRLFAAGADAGGLQDHRYLAWIHREII